MKSSIAFVVAVVIAVGLATFGRASAGPAIFVDNYNYVTAYPTGASGNVAPIAITPDMIYPAAIAQEGGIIVVTNPNTNTVALYQAGAAGNVLPFEIIAGSKTRLAQPTGIALDQHGNIYVLNRATANITVYPLPPYVTGTSAFPFNQPPSAVIAGPKTKLRQPVAIAVDESGDIYVANQLGGPVVPGERLRQGTITMYPAGSNGDVAPAAMIKGSAAGLVDPVSLALDADRNIYVGNGYTYVGKAFVDEPSITVYPAGSAGDASPSAVIGGTSTGLSFSPSLALDSGGNIYAAGSTSKGIPTVNIYPPTSNGNVAPTSSIVGPDTGLSSVSAMTLDPAGNLYVLNDEEVSIYSAGSSGDAPPINTFSSAFTGIDGSSGIALDATGQIYVANSYGGPDFPTGSLSVYAPGSYATTAPVSVIEGDNTGLNYPQKVAVDGKGNISVLNLNNVVTIYPPGSVGNVTPNATINLKSGNLGATAIARGVGDQLYVANQGSVECNDGDQNCRQTSLGGIDIYPVQSNGNAKPGAVISGYATGIASPAGVAVSKRGNIFVTNQGPLICACVCFPAGQASITVYAPGSKANAEPIATIQGPQTRLAFPQAIAVDSNENIYVMEGEGGVYSFICPGILANSEPTTTSGGLGKGNLGGAAPDIYLVPGVFDLGVVAAGSSILVFKADSNGDTPPSAVIAGPFTALGGSGIAIGPSDPPDRSFQGD